MGKRCQGLEQEIAALKCKLKALMQNLPKHSVKASQLMRIEELEERIAEKEAELASFKE